MARASSAFVTSSVVSGGAHELPQLPPHPNFAFHSPPPPRLLRGEHELHDSLDLRLRRTEGEPSDDDGARGRSSLDPRRPRAGEMPSALRRPGDTPGETPGERPPPPLPKLPPPPPPVPLAAAAAACRPPQKLTERGSSPPRSAEAAEEDLCQGTVAGKRQEGKRQEGRRVGGQAGRRAGWRGGGVARWRGGGAAGRRGGGVSEIHSRVREMHTCGCPPSGNSSQMVPIAAHHTAPALALASPRLSRRWERWPVG